MFDTVVFNRVVEGVLDVRLFLGRVLVHATHIQQDELDRTRDEIKKQALLEVFQHLVGETSPTASWALGTSRLGKLGLGARRKVPTESAVWDVSSYGQAQFTAEDNLYEPIKAALDALNKAKKNNVEDALIAETAIKRGLILITDDTDLADVTKKYGGECLSVAELIKSLGNT